jgi:Flp pilus assembly protein TadB
MFDLTTLIALVLGLGAVIAATLRKTRRRAERDATQTLKDKDVSNAQDISNAVARSRADRRQPDPDSLPAADDKRGWRD